MKASTIAGAALVATLVALHATPSYAAVVLDIRQFGTTFGSGNNLTIAEGSTVTVGIYLNGFGTLAPNGLGAYEVHLISRNERFAGPLFAPWPGSRSLGDTVGNFDVGTNTDDLNVTTGAFELSPSPGTIVDSVAPQDSFDTDRDVVALRGTQTGVGGWVPLLGVGTELLLGTVDFTALTDAALFPNLRPLDRRVTLTSFGSFNTPGESFFRALSTASTKVNKTGAFQEFSIDPMVITVTAVPEPATVTSLAIGAGVLLILRVRKKIQRSE